VTPAEFKSSLSGSAPPAVSQALLALWWAAKDEWDKAHSIAQDEKSVNGSWVHAYLHRVEGDLGNAGYWYSRAGKPASSLPLQAEWDQIVSALLTKS
jgi:hypothetical protein